MGSPLAHSQPASPQAPAALHIPDSKAKRSLYKAEAVRPPPMLLSLAVPVAQGTLLLEGRDGEEGGEQDAAARGRGLQEPLMGLAGPPCRIPGNHSEAEGLSAWPF